MEGEFRSTLKMCNLGCEKAELLLTSAKQECLGMAAGFCVWLMKRIELVHQDEDLLEPQQIPYSYNPPSGKAYYFTPHRNQIRKMPEYVLDGQSKKKKKYDDDPLIDDHCSKKYPLVSCGGFGHMFLWFCPVHGHSYGFHLIAGGEGRKDPFASIYKYMELPPADIFCDNACQLSEYALNREPKWLMNTRFLHDLFQCNS